MDLVRLELGDEAIVVATQKNAGGAGVRVTAALEESDRDPPPVAPEPEPTDVPEFLRHALAFHGVPTALAARLADAAGDDADPLAALAGAFRSQFAFGPLIQATPSGPPPPILLVGTPGAGKTLVAAKLAARARAAGRPVAVISTDTRRPGGIAQLQALIEPIGIAVAIADGPDRLAAALAETPAPGGTVIDTPSAAPRGARGMEYLGTLVAAAESRPTLVVAAGADPLEAADNAAPFADLGARSLLVTHLDLARRLGGLLAAADAGRLHFTDASVTAQADDGLIPVDPMSLARLILPHSAPPPALH